ncbi:ABC transporter ATP-binding protein, partial [Candidatus Falkowbacteria bacterium]|nr:ABC transporter ATP-binding protein [Candidatus Falkowbacteria bacterium]
MNNYSLNKPTDKSEKLNILATLAKLLPLVSPEKKRIVLATFAVFINSAFNLTAPVLVGYAVDHYIVTKQFHGVLVFGAILLLIYILALIASYFQTILMGTVGQNVLFD